MLETLWKVLETMGILDTLESARDSLDSVSEFLAETLQRDWRVLEILCIWRVLETLWNVLDTIGVY